MWVSLLIFNSHQHNIRGYQEWMVYKQKKYMWNSYTNICGNYYFYEEQSFKAY
jgi:hypothetical protein